MLVSLLLSLLVLPLIPLILLCFVVALVVAGIVLATVCDYSVYHNMGASRNHMFPPKHALAMYTMIEEDQRTPCWTAAYVLHDHLCVPTPRRK